MSSIVSRNPPPSASTSQAKDFFWMSIRFGTSIDLSRRANVRRVREASAEAKTATRPGSRGGAGAARQHSTTKSTTRRGGAHTYRTRPAQLPYVAGGAVPEGAWGKYSAGT